MNIGIVGAGQVGATAAYSMMMRRVGSGILLVDRNADLAVAQARDILDATPFADPVRVRAGEFADLDGARLVVLAAGTNQRPGRAGWICCRATPKSSQRSCRQCWQRRRTRFFWSRPIRLT
jgi:malate/lactate dehydrogenase